MEASPLNAPFDPSLYDWLALGSVGGAGLRNSERIEAIAGVEGHLVYGPYLTLPQGRYRAVFGLQVEQTAMGADFQGKERGRAVYLDVVSDEGSHCFGSLEIDARELKSGNYGVAFQIGPEDQTRRLEARVWTSGETSFAVSSINLESMEDVSAIKNRYPNIPMRDERARDVQFGSHFPRHDKYWMQALVVARNCIEPGETLVAPHRFLGYFPNTIDYQLIDEDSLPTIDWLILHKGLAADIGVKIMREIRQRSTPVFANEVFVIFSNKTSAPRFAFDAAHLDALWNRMDELEKTASRQPLKEKAASFAAVITTYNRPWALARSLPQIVNLCCPVVVVNDGSDPKQSDDYRKIRDQYAWALVDWIDLPANRGVSCAINAGVSYFLADPTIDWISYFQDDVDVHPEIFQYLARVQDPVERPLLTGRRAPEHPVLGEGEINGTQVFLYHSVPGQHLHAHRNYWRGVMPVPSFKVGLPKPHQGSGCDWWIGSWAPNSVCKKGRKIICVPRLVSTFATGRRYSTWNNEQVADDGLLPAPDAAPKTISFCTTCANRLHQFRQTFAANLKIIIENPDTEWIIFNLNSKDELHEFMMEKLPALPPRVVYARDLSNHPWHVSVAKNVAHRLASGNILVNLDCDNFIGTALDVIRTYFTSGVQALHLWSGTLRDGTFGRIAMDREVFYRLGGYDESFHPMGYQDADLLERAGAQGMRVLHFPSLSDLAIKNDKADSMDYCSGSGAEWERLNGENMAKSRFNIESNRLIANEGKSWGQLKLEIFRGKGREISGKDLIRVVACCRISIREADIFRLWLQYYAPRVNVVAVLIVAESGDDISKLEALCQKAGARFAIQRSEWFNSDDSMAELGVLVSSVEADWILHADSDEFLYEIGELREILWKMQKEGADHAIAWMADRLAFGGRLASVENLNSVEELETTFPVRAGITAHLANGCPEKVCLNRWPHMGAIHEARPPLCRKASRQLTFEHFKWNTSLEARLKKRIRDHAASELPWGVQSERILAELESHGRIRAERFLAPRSRRIPGWMDDEELYISAVENAEDGGHIVQVGVWQGRSLCFLAEAALAMGKTLRIDGVDPFRNGSQGKGRRPEELREWVTNQSFLQAVTANLKAQRMLEYVNLIQLDSLEAARIFPKESLDFVCLDASQTYDAIRAEIQAWWPLIKPGGTLAGRDYEEPEIQGAVNDFDFQGASVRPWGKAFAVKKARIACAPAPQPGIAPKDLERIA